MVAYILVVNMSWYKKAKASIKLDPRDKSYERDLEVMRYIAEEVYIRNANFIFIKETEKVWEIAFDVTDNVKRQMLEVSITGVIYDAIKIFEEVYQEFCKMHVYDTLRITELENAFLVGQGLTITTHGLSTDWERISLSHFVLKDGKGVDIRIMGCGYIDGSLAMITDEGCVSLKDIYTKKSFKYLPGISFAINSKMRYIKHKDFLVHDHRKILSYRDIKTQV